LAAPEATAFSTWHKAKEGAAIFRDRRPFGFGQVKDRLLKNRRQAHEQPSSS
jgi:hypothetical protein